MSGKVAREARRMRRAISSFPLAEIFLNPAKRISYAVGVYHILRSRIYNIAQRYITYIQGVLKAHSELLTPRFLSGGLVAEIFKNESAPCTYAVMCGIALKSAPQLFKLVQCGIVHRDVFPADG